jgi:membrane protein implicated in regulation of membrane protease activity/DNA-binding CsgD family transcriptional regulator
MGPFLQSGMAPWLLWLIVGIAALTGEVFTLSLFLASVGAAAFLTALLSLFVTGVIQIVVFLVLALLFILVVRPVALRLLGTQETPEAPRLAPSESVGTVVDRVGRGRGMIRIGEGEFWSARPVDPDVVIRPGQEVEIVETQGVVAVVRPLPRAAVQALAGDANPSGLSPREIEVLRLVALGLSNDEIAKRLVVSPRTVDHHVSHILTKMSADNRTEAVRVGMEQGLLGSGQEP